MTISHRTILTCDECGDTVEGLNAAEARKTARDRWWLRLSGLDLCAACVYERDRAAEREAAEITAWMEGS